MSTIVPQTNLINDVDLQKFMAANKMGQVISMIKNHGPSKMIKTASVGNKNSKEELITLFSTMLKSLDMTADNDDMKKIVDKISTNSKDIQETNLLVRSLATDMRGIANGLSNNIGNNIGNNFPNFSKQAAIKNDGEERKTDIKIVSKSIRDSHYQIDIAKDIIQKEGKKMYMVSCYARDAYLGRYLIKRNYFYTIDREKFANESYDEIFTKMSSIKDKYYNEIIPVLGIVTQIKQVLDGVISEIKMEEDSIATNISR